MTELAYENNLFQNLSNDELEHVDGGGVLWTILGVIGTYYTIKQIVYDVSYYIGKNF